MTRGFRRLYAALICVLACVGLTVIADRGDAGTTAETFAAGKPWHGVFSDPSVLKVGNTYWAYATVCCGANLPVTHSTDLSTWYARSAYPPDSNPGWWSGYNDALPHPAKWAVYNIQRNGRWFTAPWAPSVGYVSGHYVLAYSVPVNTSGRRCISIAVSGSPQGQFFDNSSRPFVCSSDPQGSNDPQVYTDASGAYLIWKNNGVPGSAPTKIWVRKLNAAGTGWAANSTAHFLLQTAQPWEGNVIENPAMIKYGSRYYLFYSGNRYTTSAYATGYAICAGVYGPCHRVQGAPLLASGGGVAGPGGATPFVGPSGALRLAYAAWDAGRIGGSYPRRMHIARLTVDGRGQLSVATRG
ncbi:MAG TPA: glycoside hydrolase family 43 protein [Jatrophihabitans sp.]|nr:glycoside hydrolase family 43 protein [Jatrophihabitans sp.]